ncbi:MAG: hypothetical protein ABI321_02715 [Polyangia bacterium]
MNACARLALVLVALSSGAALAESPLIPKDVATMLRRVGREQRAAETKRIATDLRISPRAQRLLKESMGGVPSAERLAQGRAAGLTNLQTAALVSYTGFGSAATNGASRSDDPKQKRHWAPLLGAMRGVVKTLPKVKGTAYRTQSWGADWNIGDTVKLKGITSVSKNVREGAPVDLVLRVKRGVDVSRFSAYPQEAEMLLPPSAVRVVDKQRTDTGWRITVEQK